MTTPPEPDYIVKPSETSTEETEGARQLTLHSFIIGTVIVLMLNSGSILDMSRSLPFGPMRDTGEALARTWNDRMESYGLNHFYQDVERRVQAFRKLRWQKESGNANRDSAARLPQERIEVRDI